MPAHLPRELILLILQLLPDQFSSLRSVCRTLHRLVDTVCTDLYKPYQVPMTWVKDLARSWTVFNEIGVDGVASAVMRSVLLKGIELQGDDLLRTIQHFLPQMHWAKHAGCNEQAWREAMFVLSLALGDFDLAAVQLDGIITKSLRVLVAVARFGGGHNMITIGELLLLNVPNDNDWAGTCRCSHLEGTFANRRAYVFQALVGAVVCDDVGTLQEIMRYRFSMLSEHVHPGILRNLTMLAARTGAVAVLACLYDEDEELDEESGDDTLLYAATSGGHLQAMFFLLNVDPGVGRHNPEHFVAALQSAAARCNAGGLIVLSEMRPELFDEHRNLLYAFVFGDPHSTIYWSDFRDLRDRESKAHMIDFVARYMDQDVNTRCPRGRTSLHHAARAGDAISIHAALALGADQSIVDTTGQTAWEVAISHKEYRLAECLSTTDDAATIYAQKEDYAARIAGHRHRAYVERLSSFSTALSGDKILLGDADDRDPDCARHIWHQLCDLHVKGFSIRLLASWTAILASDANKALDKVVCITFRDVSKLAVEPAIPREAFSLAKSVLRQLCFGRVDEARRNRSAAICAVYVSIGELQALSAFLDTELGRSIAFGLYHISDDYSDLFANERLF